ncbi:MAG TPA: phage tail tape measure protein, partial [Dielma fastidiosa]|nr:phage tail tape measure protein [Dielma fastidiosa]
MAKKLEGLTVQLGLDTTPITSALSGLNKNFNNSQKELREVNRLLKFDPANTALLAQKQELLADSINACSDKLKILKEAESQVQEQFERGDIKEEKYREFQREVVATENKLKSLKSQVDTTNKTLADMGSAAKAAGEKMNAAGDKLLPLSAALTGVATAAVAAMNNVDDGIDRIATATGATGDKLKAMTDIYYDVVTKMPVEFESAGAAIGEINTRFGYLGDKLGECTEDFLKFAKVNNMDATESVRLVSRAMNDAGIDASEYKRVLDLMTKAAQDSGISVSKLAESVTTFGAPMRALGFDMDESIALFASWEKAGVNAETAFSGLKKSISTWASEGKDAREEFKKTLDEIKATPDIAEATTKAIEVFGTKAGPDLADAIKGGRFEYEEFLNTLQGSTNVIDNTYGAIVDDVDATQVAIQTAQVALHDIGETIMVTVGPILKDLSDGLRDVTQHFNALDDGTKKAIITAGGMAIAAGPVLKATGGITTGIGNIMTGLSKLKPLIKSTEAV